MMGEFCIECGSNNFDRDCMAAISECYECGRIWTDEEEVYGREDQEAKERPDEEIEALERDDLLRS
jgi:hypothetical protein